MVLASRPLCEWPGCNQAASEVDHVVALSKGGTNDETNLRPLCKAHHSAKTVREDGGFGRVKRGQRVPRYGTRMRCSG